MAASDSFSLARVTASDGLYSLGFAIVLGLMMFDGSPDLMSEERFLKPSMVSSLLEDHDVHNVDERARHTNPEMPTRSSTLPSGAIPSNN